MTSLLTPRMVSCDLENSYAQIVLCQAWPRLTHSWWQSRQLMINYYEGITETWCFMSYINLERQNNYSSFFFLTISVWNSTQENKFGDWEMNIYQEKRSLNLFYKKKVAKQELWYLGFCPNYHTSVYCQDAVPTHTRALKPSAKSDLLSRQPEHRQNTTQ